MTDTEFPIQESLLFLEVNALADEPQNLPDTVSQEPVGDVEMLQGQSILFPNQHAPISNLEGLVQEPVLAKAKTDNPNKTVQLMNGRTIQLRPRRKKNVSLTFSDDPNAIINMDKLYERVGQRERLRDAQEKIRNLKQQKKQLDKEPLPQLWLEKYSPKSYLQICPAGNEKQYRLVMHWLHKWSAVVFGTAKDDAESVDSLGRPFRKILLVHGPPGVGKTTVVHLLAKQMGYSLQELNAANSMDALQGADATEGAGRFANASASLKLKVKNALTSNTIDSNGKPTCLVIDEIDSTLNTNDIVKVISELVRTDQANLRAKESQGFRSDPKTRSKKKPFFLNRPIICIANDIYNVSSRSWGQNPMETLRPLCEIIAFRRPTTNASLGARVNATAQKSVKEFLMSISEKEKLGLDRKEIAEVFDLCEGDIRACINYLQFSSRKLDTSIHLIDKGVSENAFNKDSLISWFALVDQIFRRNQSVSKEENFEQMLDLVSSGSAKSAASGSLDKVIRGCFNKYLDVVHLQDDSVARPAEISDWLFHYDIFTSGNLSMSFFPTLATLKFWSLFSDINPHKFNDMEGLIPDARNIDFNSRETLKQNKSVVERLTKLIPIESRVSLCGMAPNSIFHACEFIPFLDRMLTPDVGSSKIKTMLQTHEMNQIDRLAKLIKSFGIKLESQKDVGSNQTYLVYGPDWEGITMFETTHQNFDQRRRALNVKRQWLFPLLQSELVNLENALKRPGHDLLEAEKQGARPKKPKITSSLDFFKGQYDDILNKTSTSTKPANREATRIWVKHHEGFSNAVRKNIGWYELWH